MLQILIEKATKTLSVYIASYLSIWNLACLNCVPFSLGSGLYYVTNSLPVAAEPISGHNGYLESLAHRVNSHWLVLQADAPGDHQQRLPVNLDYLRRCLLRPPKHLLHRRPCPLFSTRQLITSRIVASICPYFYNWSMGGSIYQVLF